ncbi:MAG: YciI family protein [Acidimicrobiia bacterium]
MGYFAFIHRPGPAWRPGAPVLEQRLEGHFAYMAELETSGVLVVGGGFGDDTGALGIIQAASIDEAIAVVLRDPAVEDGVVVTEVHPLLITVGGRVKRSVD